jgi:hypothetical protein
MLRAALRVHQRVSCAQLARLSSTVPPLGSKVPALSAVPSTEPKAPKEDCSVVESDDSDEDMVEMVDAATGEWGGPTRGGTMPEPTRFGDWERKGRCTDFA